MAQTIGLRARLDLAAFNNQVRSFIQLTQKISQETTRVAQQTTREVGQSREAVNSLGLSWGRVKDIILGVTVIDFFRTLRRGIDAVATEAINATASFQNLSVQLNAILARDYSKEFGVPAADALALVSEQSQELLGWVRQLAARTPFSVENIAKALAYGQAFGFNVEQTKRLTIAIGDFTAGMGLTDEHFQRILYNFGQMLASGRVLGREMRDLANNFVPVNEVLEVIAEQMGVTIDQVKEMQKEGTLSAEQFIGTFVELAEQDFPGAMERMSRTINGVRQNLQDFVHTLLGLELLGPVMRAVAEDLAAVLDKVFTDEVVTSFTVVGEAILIAYNTIRAALFSASVSIQKLQVALGIATPTAWDFATAILYLSEVFRLFIEAARRVINEITIFVGQISRKFDVKFVEVVANAKTWGYNIIVSLAEGMANAISAVISAISYIASVITSFLQSFSPPKILPNLPDWGQAAMESYLEGWKLADFDIFNDIADIIESYIRSIPGGIGKDNVGLVPLILGSREAIAKAINDVRSGFKTLDQAVQSIFGSVEGITGEFRNYIYALFQVEAAQLAVADATKAVKAAQDELNQITNEYNAILNDLYAQLSVVTDQFDENARLAEIQKALNSGLLTDEEKARLEAEKQSILIKQQIREVEAQKDAATALANEKIDAAKAAEDAAKLELEAAEKSLDLAKFQIEAQIKTNKLLQEQLALLERLARRSGGVGSSDPDEDPYNLGGFGGVEDALEALEEDITGKLMEIRNNIRSTLEGVIDDLVGPFREIKDELGPLGEEITGALEAFKMHPNTIAFVEAVKQFAADLVEAFGNVKTFWEENGDGIIEILGGFFERLGDLLKPELQAAFDAFILKLGEFGDWIVTMSELLVENGPQIQEQLQGWIDWIFEEGIPKLGAFIDELEARFIPIWERFGPVLLENLPEITAALLAFGLVLSKIQLVLTILYPILVPMISALGLLTLAGKAISGIIPAFSFLGSVLGKIAAIVGPMLPQITAFFGLLVTEGPAALSLINPLFLILGVAAAAVATAFARFSEETDKITTVIKGSFSQTLKKLEPSLAGLKQSFQNIGIALSPIIEKLQPVIDFVLDSFGRLGLVIYAALGGIPVAIFAIINGLIGGFTSAFNYIAVFISNVISAWSGLWEGIKTAAEGFWNFLVGLFTGNVDLLVEGINGFADGIVGIFTNLWTILSSNIVGGLGAIIEFFKGFIESVIDFFKGLADDLVGNSIIPDMLSDIWTAFSEAFTTLLTDIGTWIGNIITDIGTKAIEFKDKAVELFNNFKDGIVDRFTNPDDGIFKEVGDRIQGVVDKIVEFLEDFKETAVSLWNKFKDGITEMFTGEDSIITFVNDKIQEVVDEVASFATDWVTEGWNIVLGIIKGIGEKAQELFDTIAALIRNALGIAEDEAGAESPAKKFMPLGRNIVEGLEVGMLNQFQSTKQVLGDMLGEMSDMAIQAQTALPTDAFNRLYSRAGFGRGFAGLPAMSPTFNRNITINVDANYGSNAPAANEIYYDVAAALSHIAR